MNSLQTIRIPIIAITISSLLGTPSQGQLLRRLGDRLKGIAENAVPAILGPALAPGAAQPRPNQPAANGIPGPNQVQPNPVQPNQPTSNRAVNRLTQQGVLGMVGDDENRTAGVRVLSVTAGAAAAAAGLSKDDVIVKVNQRSIRTMDDLGRELAGKGPGAQLQVTFLRSGNRQQTNVTLQPPAAVPGPANAGTPPPASPTPELLPGVPMPGVPNAAAPLPAQAGSRPTNDSLAAPGTAPPASILQHRAALGVTVATVDPAWRTQFRLPAVQGAVVTSVIPGSAAAQAMIPLGAVITRFNNKPITAPADLVRELALVSVNDQVPVSFYVGTRAVRANVRLTAAPQSVQRVPTLPAPNGLSPAPIQPPPAAGRPGPLNRLEGLLGRRRNRNPATATTPTINVQALAVQVQQLQQQVTTLQQQVRDLQQQLQQQQQPIR